MLVWQLISVEQPLSLRFKWGRTKILMYSRRLCSLLRNLTPKETSAEKNKNKLATIPHLIFLIIKKIITWNQSKTMQNTLMNSGSHFSEDKYNLAIVYALLLLIFLVLTVVNFKKYQEDKERFEEEDSPLYFTFGSLNMVVMHCVLKCIHNF